MKLHNELQPLPYIDRSISKETKKKNGEEERHVESRHADVSKSLQRIERGTQVLKRHAGETGREDRQTDRQTVSRTDGRLLSPSPQKQEAQPRYSSNFSRRNIHEQPRPSVLFRFYSPLQIGQPGSESLLYEAGNPCRWERLKGAAGAERGRVRRGDWWRKSERDELVLANRPASTLQLAKVQQQSCCHDIEHGRWPWLVSLLRRSFR